MLASIEYSFTDYEHLLVEGRQLIDSNGSYEQDLNLESCAEASDEEMLIAEDGNEAGSPKLGHGIA